MQIQTHMKLGSGFAPAVLRPVDAGGYQRNRAGVHHMNNAPETTSQPFASTSCAKSGRKLLQVLEHRPEQPFSQRSIATLIGMGKVVATRSSGSAQGRKRAAVQSQRVTDVIKADGVRQLRKEHADHVTPCTEGTCHGLHTRLARKFRNQMRRNEIAKLPKNAEFGCGWFGVSFFHLCRVTELKNHSNHFFLCLTKIPMGWLWTSLNSSFVEPERN